MNHKCVKLSYTLLLILSLTVPAFVQAMPANSVLLGKLMTFATITVDIVSVSGPNSYSPDTITINSGDTVIWHNVQGITHSATCGTGTPCGMWDTGLFSTGFSAPIPYTSFASGTTHYYCTFHGDGLLGMYGAVINNSTTTNVGNWETYSSADKTISPKKNAGPFGIVFVSQNEYTSNHSSSVSESAVANSAVHLHGATQVQVGMMK